MILKISAHHIIYSFDIEEEDEEIVLTVSGNGFLYNMVRMLTGTLLDVGTGRMSPDKIPELLAAKERVHSPNTAPARGLTLLDIEYL